MTKLSDYVFDFLSGLGVGHAFMLPGGGAMHLVDSLGRSPKIKFVCNLHEQACAIAASAYTQYTNSLGVVLVTTGPGGTNTVTGVAGAWLDSIPCLFLSGQVKRDDSKDSRGVRQMGFQEIGIVDIVGSITKYAVTVTDPDTIRYHLEKAAYLARNGRPGPVWLDIPLDVQAAEIDEAALERFEEKEVQKPVKPGILEEQVAEAIRLLNQADRPVILVGNGVRLSGAVTELLQLVERLQVPVLTTWKAIDLLPESHPLHLGRPGAVGQRGANFTQQNSDWLLTMGARLDLGQTGYSHANFARAAKKTIVDVDPAEIGKMMMPIDVSVCADAGDFIREMLRQSDSYCFQDRHGWLARCKAWQARYPVVLPEYWDAAECVNNYVLIDVLSEEMSGEDLLVPGSSGASSEITMQAFRVKAGMRVFNTQGLGPMGFGIAAAIGGCVASGRRTVCIDGDGGFAMNTQELETINRLQLPIKVFVLNNQGYVSIRNTQRSYFEGRLVGSDASSGLTLPNIARIADAYGIHSLKIENHGHIRQQVRDVLGFEGPVVCEVMVSPDQYTAPRITSMQRPDGTMVSKPLEDMWPLLSRDEFLANMLIPPVEE